MTHHGCKLSVEGLCVVVRLVEVAISPLDEVPRLRRKAGRFSAASGRNPLYSIFFALLRARLKDEGLGR